MPATLCPTCGAKLYPHETAAGRCTGCTRRSPTRYAAGRRPPRIYDDEPPPPAPRSAPARRRGEAAYATARVGVILLRWSAGLSIPYAVLGGFVLFALQLGTDSDFDGIVNKLQGTILVLSGWLIVALPGLIGALCCCAAPRRSRAAPWGRALLASLGFGLLFFLLGGGLYLAVDPVGLLQSAFNCFLMFLFLTVFAAALSLAMLLRGLARDFDDPALGGGLVACFITAIGLPMVVVPAGVAVGLILDPRRAIGGPDLGAVLVSSLGCFSVFYVAGVCFWLISLLGRLRRLLASPRPAVEPPPINGWG